MIRAATAQDAADIAALWNWMIRETLATFATDEKSITDTEALLQGRKGAFFVARSGRDLQGFATFGRFRDGPGYAATCEHSVVVSPAAQGRRVGAALMQTVEAAARASGHHVMVAAISGANPQAVRFHNAIGFKEVGHMPQVGRKAGQWLDLIVMQKFLTAGR